ncbi:MAG TPA: hypothetical protein VGM18_20090 [Candidatus Sulfotelmatobacter sp.]
MTKITKLALCVALTMLLVGAYFVVSAAGTHEAGPPRNISNLHFPPPTNEINRTNFITTATPYAVLAAGFNVEDGGATFSCPSSVYNTCTLLVNSFATSSGGGLADDDRALCLVVDGAIAGACAYNGYDAADGSYSAISSINNVVVTPGTHTAYMSFYTTYGTTMYTYTNLYSIYKP